MEMKSKLLQLQESQKRMKDQDKLTPAKFSQIRQRSPPPRILRRKRNERWEKNLTLFRVRKRPNSAPSAAPRSSPDHMQVLPDQAERNKSCKRRTTINQFHACDEANLRSMKHAKEAQMNLAPDMPSFVKFMRRSHVTGGFFLNVPANFCKLNLLEEDCTITLVDESGEEYKTKYFAGKFGLSGGWRGFSIAHNLVEGDSLVFQLIEATKLKVYIVRENGLAKFSEVSEDLALTKEILADASDRRQSISHSLSAGEQENDIEDVGFEDLEGISLATEIMEFKDVKSFEDFTIIANGLIVDSELPERVRAKYYELCCSQKAFLHGTLLQGINRKLIAGMIIETVNVANSIRSCNLTTSENDFANWDKCLDAFEHLGMNIGFLRARLIQLESLAFSSEGAMELKMYSEAVSKTACLLEEIRNLELKLVKLKESHASYDKEIETLKLKAERHEMKFQAEVNAPW